MVSCGGESVKAKELAKAPPAREIGVVKAVRKPIQRTLVVSSELIPFQQIDVYAKESGFVRKLDVDYGTHVKAGQVMAVLEIPELQAQVDEDDADIKDATGRVARTQKELARMEAQHNVAHLQFTRLDGVAKSRPGLVAQQEVDDWQGKDLAAERKWRAPRDAVASAQSQLVRAQAKRRHDQVLFDYSRITAPFDGGGNAEIRESRHLDAGRNEFQHAGAASGSAFSRRLFRLVIPVSESYVRYVRIGDPVDVRVPALNRSFPGKVARFSVDVQWTRVPCIPKWMCRIRIGVLLPGLYAEATLTLDRENSALGGASGSGQYRRRSEDGLGSRSIEQGRRARDDDWD